jgi:L-seryl-tRNA(Ser) seleniumtransferase
VVDEPTVNEIVASGADVISFSGDKLLGSAQAGLIVGKRTIVEQLRKHPLYRALRSDKLRLAALEATLTAFQRDKAFEEVPVLQMLSRTTAEIEQRAKALIEHLGPTALHLSLEPGESAIGGGAAPTSTIKSVLIALSHQHKSAGELEQQLRNSSPAVVARISEDKVLLDLRTVSIDDSPALIAALKRL